MTLLGLCALPPAAVAQAHKVLPGTASVPAQVAAAAVGQTVQIDDLTRRVDDLRDVVQLIFLPITVLISVLALGGVIGVVFSFRDQRRVSQMHELAVSTEMSGQRRSEQSYTTFLDESQKTLTLVNDTLELAREATDRAAHSMEQKAESRLARIEERAQRALLPSLEKGRFENVVDDPRTRSDVQAIATELAAIEGYLILQDIGLGPYSRFVRGLAQYLNDDTEGALATLRTGAQDRSVRELQLFSIYWVGYLHIARGNYDDAAQIFKTGEETLSEKALERVEFDRMIDDANFFSRAQFIPNADPSTRLAAVAHLLADLEEVAARLDRGEHDPRSPTSHEVAETRGDIFAWIAHDPDRLFEPLRRDAIEQAKAQAIATTDRSDDSLASPPDAQAKRGWGLSGDALRAWALLQAEDVYAGQRDEAVDFQLMFRHVECDFVLDMTSSDDAIPRYRTLERTAIEMLGTHREHRKWSLPRSRSFALRDSSNSAGTERAPILPATTGHRRRATPSRRSAAHTARFRTR